MEVRCDKCQARYRVDDARIGPQGLTMRCGKCQNTFKVTKAEAAPAAPPPAPAVPAPKAPAAPARPAGAVPRQAEAAPQATMAFGQSPAPARPAMPSAPRSPPASAAKPGPAASEEGAGRTMMFQTGNLKTTPPPGTPAAKPEAGSVPTMVFGQSPIAPPKAAAAAKPATRPAGPESGATMVFGQSPIAPPRAPISSIPAARPPPGKPAAKDAAGSTMMFGAASALAKGPAAPKAAPPAPAPEPEPEAAGDHQTGGEPGADAGAHTDELPLEEPSHRGGVEAEGAEQEEASRPSTFDKAPPKGLLIGVAAGLAALLVAGGVLVAVKKLGKRPPPPAAVETLSSAQADADKDTLASLSAAESKAKDALEVAGPKARFPQATAALARIEIQWADAFNDQAALIAQKGGDGADAKVADLQGQAKAKLKSAFDLLAAAVKTDKDSADLRVALADYYRAQRSNANMNKYLKLVKDDPRAQLIQGMSAAQEEDGAEKAIPKLTAALSASPQSARIHFRLALAYLAMKDDAKGLSELKETLKISPQHERAKLVMEQVPASAEQK